MEAIWWFVTLLAFGFMTMRAVEEDDSFFVAVFGLVTAISLGLMALALVVELITR